MILFFNSNYAKLEQLTLLVPSLIRILLIINKKKKKVLKIGFPFSFIIFNRHARTIELRPFECKSNIC